MLQVPENCTSVAIDRRAGASAKWIRFRAITVKKAPTSLTVALPKNATKSEWRATGVISSPVSKARKYPAAFYRGLHAFDPTAASNYDSEPTAGQPSANSGVATLLPVASLSAVASKDAAPVATVEESDIWKADGTTIYFFNQLRGLQVIDLSDPAEPALRASLRLPASGQDMYVIPGEGSVRYAVLLTNEYDQKTCQPRTGVKVVSVDGPSASLVSEATVDGWMADSRLVGNRIYLATQQWFWSVGTQDATTLHELVVDSTSGAVAESTSHKVPGSSPVISAGNDWLAVASQDPSDWQTSRISLFQLAKDGATQLTAEPVTVFGRVYDKFKIQYSDGTLTVISQKWISTSGSWWNNTPVTELQNFSASGEVLGSLEIIKGEQLHATRFAGNKAYVVTFQRIDPLWVIDLSDPRNPAIAGQVEVPGWSTYIEPVGDLLFTIGFDGGKVAASLFDVADAANPTLLKRIKLDGNWGYSEATYDEKALKVLPDDGLVLVPYSSYAGDGTTSHYVQLLDLDVVGRDLRLRGKIAHDFEPRRATVIGASLASVSQRQLVTADISDRDNPTVLADLLLAWPVNRLVNSGDYLIEIAEGGSWSGEAPVARVALTSDPDSVLEEVGLGDGFVRDAVLREGRLYVLRQTPVAGRFGGWWSPMPVILNATLSKFSDPSQTAGQPTLHLDIYDASALPKLALTGSASSKLTGGQTYDIGPLLWASPSNPVVVVQPQSWSFIWGPYDQPAVLKKTPVRSTIASTTTIAVSDMAGFMPYPPRRRTPVPAFALVFQVADAGAPTVLKPVTLTAAGDTSVIAATAGGGSLVFGYGSKPEVLEGGTFTRCRHALRILDLQDPSKPVLRPTVDLPGKLLAITDLTPDGFLAWTESFASDSKRTKGGRELKVSASDGKDIYQVASMSLSGLGATAADGRSFYAVNDKAINRYLISDTGSFTTGGSVALDWSPNTLLSIPGGLLGSDWNHLFRAIWNDTPDGEVFDWETLHSAEVRKVIPLEKGSVLVPAGDYGVDRLDP